MPITTKRSKTPEDFISGAKAEQPPQKQTFTRDKTFLLRIPAELHELARGKAADQRVSLHEFILQAIAQAVSK